VLSHPLDRRWHFTARTGTVLTGVVAAGGVGVALLGPWLVAVMAKGDFDHTAMVHALGWLTSVAVLYMVYQGSSLAVLDAERTGRLAWTAVVSLGVLVAVAAVAAPALGIVGIALAKVAGYAVLAGSTTWFAVRHSPLRWPPAVGAVLVVALGLGIGAGGLLPLEGPLSWVRVGLAAAVALGVLAAAPGVARSLRR
jgi:O-antigen/teichoic acid export membrane protein